jgi:hypothetical protein
MSYGLNAHNEQWNRAAFFLEVEVELAKLLGERCRAATLQFITHVTRLALPTMG